MPERRPHPASAAVFFDGRTLPAAEARFPADDHGVLFGVGFYETFRTSGGRPHLWRLHQQRLERACATAGIECAAHLLAWNETKLAEVVASLLSEYGARDAVFRYTLTAGVPDPTRAGGQSVAGANAAPYQHPHELLTLRPLPAAVPRDGVALHVLSVARDGGEWLPRPKSIACANALLGAAELRRRGVAESDEGLFLSRGDGFVVETVRQNVAWICDGRICYPDPAVGAIAGTCLAWLLELGAPVAACRARLEDLRKADAVIVMNSVRGITPVREIRGADGALLAGPLDSGADPIVASLMRQWDEALQTTATTATGGAGA